jgi:MFS family permease
MKRNIQFLYSFRFFRDFLLIAPVLIPFYKANGLSAVQILSVQAVFSASMLLFEIPSGYLSDRWGRRKTLLLGGIAVVSGFALYSFSSDIIRFIFAEILLGFGFSMCSGTESAILYETLSILKRKDEYRKIESRAEFVTRFGAAVSSIAGGLLGSLGIRIPFYANTLSALALPLSAFFIKEPERPKASHANILKGILEAVVYTARHRVILSSALFSGAITMTGIISIWGYFLLLPGMEVPLSLYGVLFFGFQFSSAIGAQCSHFTAVLLGKRKTLLLFLLIPAIYIVIGVSHFKIITALAFIQSFLWGVSTPFFLDIINAHAKPDVRATILSTVSMGSRILYVAIGPVFGIIADRSGTQTGFIFLACVFALCLTAGAFIYTKKNISV